MFSRLLSQPSKPMKSMSGKEEAPILARVFKGGLIGFGKRLSPKRDVGTFYAPVCTGTGMYWTEDKYTLRRVVYTAHGTADDW